MPGIAGVFRFDGEAMGVSEVARMIDTMKHESFYTASTMAFPEVGLYCGLVDTGNVSRFAQRRGVSILVTGNAYVDPPGESRSVSGDLAGELVDIYSESDEREMLKCLVGTFAGLLIDHRLKRVFLFNDRFGFERLYICESGGVVYFSSEAKAICAVNPDTRQFDETGLTQYLALGSTIDGKSLFHNIDLLRGGSVWSWQRGNLRKQRYFESTDWEDGEKMSPTEFQKCFEETFSRICPKYTHGDSPIGISLTGGLDTRMVLATLPELAKRPVCYTYTAGDSLIRDARIARQVATAAGLRHENIRIEEDFFEDFGSLVDKTVRVTDGYFGVTGAHEIYLNSKGRELSPVRLTGVFGGEVMGDVSTFKLLRLNRKLLNPDILCRLDEVEEDFRFRKCHPISFAAFQEIPWNLYGTISACRSQVDFRTPFLDDNLVRLFYRMPDPPFDPRNSSEALIRNLDPKIGAIPTDMGALGNMNAAARLKHKALAWVTFKLDYYANDGLPHCLSSFDGLINRAGKGFGIVGEHKYLHYSRWFRTSLAEFLRERFNDSTVCGNPMWDQKVVSNLVEEHLSGKRNWQSEINAVLTISTLERQIFNPSEPVIDQAPDRILPVA